MKLISMKEFVLEESRNPFQSDTQAWIRTCKYAEFLDRPLSLYMFLPVDEIDDILREPLDKEEDEGFFGLVDAVIDKQYREAKAKVLFEDVRTTAINEHGSYVLYIGPHQIGYFKALPDYFTWHYKKVEDLTNLEDINLTISGIKKLGL